MSKPDTVSPKSLEEIIASIRKTLAGDGGAGRSSPTARTEPVLPDLPRFEPGPVASERQFTDRLAGALGEGSGAGREDDDLSEIYAGEPHRPASPFAGRPLEAPAARSPRYFADPPAPEPPREPPGLGSLFPLPAEPADEPVELSRPEVLRASLPPLFGGDADGADRSAREGAAGRSGAPKVLSVKAEPAEAPSPPPPAFVPPPALIVPPPPPVPPARAANGNGAAAPVAASFALPPVPPVTPLAAPPVSMPAPPVRPEPEAAADAALAKAADAAPAAAAPGPAGRTLEQVIGELLEPVIRHWLDNNLPGMVEKVVREEVARSLAAERPAPVADA